MKPPELVEAEIVFGMCRTYQALPDAGGVLDQSATMLRMHSVLQLGGYFDPRVEADPCSGIPMGALGMR